VLTQTAKNALKAQGVKVDELKAILGAEIFRTAVIPYEKDLVDANTDRVIRRGSRGVRVNVLMRDVEVQRLVDALRGIVGEDIRPEHIPDGTSLKSLLTKAVETLSGEATSNKSFSEAVKAITGIPARSRLMGSAKDFDALLNDREKLKGELERLTEVRKRLEDARFGRYSILKWQDRKNPDGFPIRVLEYEETLPFSPPPETRSFSFAGSFDKYYWIDVETEYP
jgi:hypothetical protein